MFVLAQVLSRKKARVESNCGCPAIHSSRFSFTGGRQEIDLLPPATTQAEVKLEPVCPQGIPSGEAGFEEPPRPGESPLDDALAKLHAPEGGAS